MTKSKVQPNEQKQKNLWKRYMYENNHFAKTRNTFCGEFLGVKEARHSETISAKNRYTLMPLTICTRQWYTYLWYVHIFFILFYHHPHRKAGAGQKYQTLSRRTFALV